MADGGNGTIYNGPQDLKSVIFSIVRKDGMLGLVLLAMGWFIWVTYENQREDNARFAPLLEKNTEAMSRNAVIQERATFTLESIKPFIERLERRLDRKPQ